MGAALASLDAVESSAFALGIDPDKRENSGRGSALAIE
jgi:hypothetical protein